MAATNIPVRFTEEKYATKQEVAKELNIHFIDSIWSTILAYRSNFNRYLTLRTIENNRLTFCSCPTVADKVNIIERKLNNSFVSYSKIVSNQRDYTYLRNYYLGESLKGLAKEYDLDVTNEYLRTIISGELKEINPSHKILLNYYNALLYVENAYVNSIDENFIAEIYCRLLDVEELTSFYRTTEDKHPENRVIIDRIYTAAPVSSIEPLMNTLFDFIKNGSVSFAVKALVAYYYINYVKPFPKHNDEIALLTAKGIFAHNSLSSFGVLLPLETLLCENVEKIAKMFVEVQKTSDITYFVNYGISIIDSLCDEIANHIANLNATSLKADFFKEDEDAILNPQEESDVTEETSQVEVIEEPVVEPVSKKVETKKVKLTPVEQEIAVTYIPTVLDEKEACRLEQHLLELDPSLKKGEAKFYARHCTLGKKYTIAQYKKAIGCVYETARTSMDHLAELGYYRKEQLKNKYVYSPIPRK